MKTYSQQSLWRHREKLVDGNVRPSLDAIRQSSKIVLQVRRPVARTFYGAGERLPFHPDDFYPFGKKKGALGVSEEWYVNCGRVVTGNKNPEDGDKPFFREGQAHAIDPDNDLVLFQDMVLEDPDFMIGSATAALATKWFGEVTVPIYDKHFDPDRVLPGHRHNRKWELYNHDPTNNRCPPTPGYHTTAMAYYPWVTPDLLLAALHMFGKGNSMALRSLQPHVLMPIGWGFGMPDGVDHAPTNLCTQEPQRRDDEHVLLEDHCGDIEITPEVAWLACMEEDIPTSERSWERIVEMTDWDTVCDPDFVKKHQCRPRLDDVRSSHGDGTVTWVIYSLIRGQQMASTQRIVVPAGGRHVLYQPSWSICHMLQGKGIVGGQEVEFVPQARLGQLTRDRWFTPYGFATAAEGIEVVNTGSEDLIFKATFGPDAFPMEELPRIAV